MASLFDLLKKKPITLQYEGRSGPLELMKIDATISENHRMSAKVTEHEVEDGSNISDHTVIAGDTLTLQGIISDDPITLAAAAVGNIGGVVGSIVGDLEGAVVTGAISKLGSNLLAQGGKRSVLAWQAFEFMRRERIPIIIITGLKSYTNMILEDVTAPRRVQTKDALEFTATFKKVRIVQSETVTVPLSSLDPDVENATKKRNEGKKPLKDLGDKATEKSASILSQLTGAGA